MDPMFCWVTPLATLHLKHILDAYMQMQMQMHTHRNGLSENVLGLQPQMIGSHTIYVENCAKKSNYQTVQKIDQS